MQDANGFTTHLLSRLLKASELRARVLSSNIANQNTPGYTRQDVQFEGLVRQALLENGRPSSASVTPVIELDREAQARPDGNNVTLELELNAMRENRILYETYAAILAGRFELLRAAVEHSR